MTETLLSKKITGGRILRILAVSFCLVSSCYHFVPNSISIPTWYTDGTVEKKTNPPSLDNTLLAETLGDTIDELQKQLENTEKRHQIEIEDIKAKIDQVLTKKEEIAFKFPKQPEPMETKDKTAVKQKQPAATKANKVEILRDPNATIASDIASIYHFPDQSTIVVDFHARARCPRPYLMGRISGPALIALQWKWSRESSADNISATTMYGIYSTPVIGKYFLEIMVVHCNNFAHGIKTALEDADITAIDILNATGQHNPLTFDFKPVCVEDPLNGRITDKAAMITVEKKTEKLLQGFWRKAAKVETPRPVFTRFQLPVCHQSRKDRASKRNLSQVCLEQPGLDQFRNYDFEWSPSLQLNASYLIHAHSLQTNLTRVCYAGSSHSRTMLQAARRLGLSHTVKWVLAKYPKDVTKLIPVLHEAQCGSLVVGVVQWPASFDQNHPTKLGQYYQELKDMVLQLQQERPGMKLFFRSVHSMALYANQLVCPPGDWRTPTAMNGYSEVIQHVCREMNITFLDTTFLTAPVWDAAPDWCHLDDRTSNAEVLFLTGSALGVVEDGEVKQGHSKETA
jgi:hypothetical protein